MVYCRSVTLASENQSITTLLWYRVQQASLHPGSAASTSFQQGMRPGSCHTVPQAA